jgi:hypothetical protein
MHLSYLAIGGSLCLIVALIEAWLIVGHFSSPDGPVARLIPGGKDLVRSHIDYLMMAQFQFIFYGLYRFMGLTPSGWVIAAICFGSFFNPFGFLVRAVKPSYVNPPAPYLTMMMTSCIATTLGFGVTAWTLAAAAINAP